MLQLEGKDARLHLALADLKLCGDGSARRRSRSLGTRRSCGVNSRIIRSCFSTSCFCFSIESDMVPPLMESAHSRAFITPVILSPISLRPFVSSSSYASKVKTGISEIVAIRSFAISCRFAFCCSWRPRESASRQPGPRSRFLNNFSEPFLFVLLKKEEPGSDVSLVLLFRRLACANSPMPATRVSGTRRRSDVVVRDMEGAASLVPCSFPMKRSGCVDSTLFRGNSSGTECRSRRAL